MNSHMLRASEVRKDWGKFIDDTVRHKPQFVKRSRDQMITMGYDLLQDLLKAYPLTADIYHESDGTVTLSLKQMDLAASGLTEDDALMNLAQDMIEYAEEFYEAFEYWSSAPNRRSHVPYVLRILSSKDIAEVRGLVQCRHGNSTASGFLDKRPTESYDEIKPADDAHSRRYPMDLGKNLEMNSAKNVAMDMAKNFATNPVMTAILNRRSCRTFKPDPVSDERIEALLTAAKYAASGMGRQAWHFTVVLNAYMMERIVDNIKAALLESENPRLREVARSESFNPFYNAPVCIIVSADASGSVTTESASLAIGNMLLAAESFGLGACWINSITDLKGTALGLELIRELRIPSGYLPVGSVVVGYREGDVPKAAPRKEGTVNYIR